MARSLPKLDTRPTKNSTRGSRSCSKSCWTPLHLEGSNHEVHDRSGGLAQQGQPRRCQHLAHRQRQGHAAEVKLARRRAAASRCVHLQHRRGRSQPPAPRWSFERRKVMRFFAMLEGSGKVVEVPEGGVANVRVLFSEKELKDFLDEAIEALETEFLKVEDLKIRDMV